MNDGPVTDAQVRAIVSGGRTEVDTFLVRGVVELKETLARRPWLVDIQEARITNLEGTRDATVRQEISRTHVMQYGYVGIAVTGFVFGLLELLLK